VEEKRKKAEEEKLKIRLEEEREVKSFIDTFKKSTVKNNIRINIQYNLSLFYHDRGDAIYIYLKNLLFNYCMFDVLRLYFRRFIWVWTQ